MDLGEGLISFLKLDLKDKFYSNLKNIGYKNSSPAL